MREVAIAQTGIVTAAGNDLEATWNYIMTGRTALRKIDRFPVKAYSSEICGWIPGLKSSGKGSLIRNLRDLLLDQMDPVPPDSLLITSSTKAGIDNLEKIKRGEVADPEDMIPSSITERVKARLGLNGRSFHISAACASSTVAAAQGMALIAAGIAESVLIFCLDLLTESVFSGFSAFQILSPSPCRPFDRDRSGLSVGEGGAFLLLMSADRARELGRPEKGILAGAGISSDARHITAPDRTGAGLIRAVEAAIKTAGIKKEDIAGISAHGTGTVYNDLMELTAFRTLFGKQCPPLYSVKGCLGHTFGAAGGIEIVLGTRILSSQTLPPTAGFVHPEQGAEGIVSAQAVSLDGDYLLTTNSGFGGINAATILKKGGRP
ncbi:MAG: beta-ketoacyl-[acyl-carrier-protein] synthase family protein [Deltaproteobacteria bacterium]|nr:beta-ketoacyl-[acyl-carrier-protein] synthase family protein [Deltaproteobacteria bacterium]